MLIGERVFVATENNATRVYQFDQSGILAPDPVFVNEDLAPDTCSAVVVGNQIFASGYGELFCLDIEKDFATVWQELDDRFYDHCNLIGGKEHVLIWNSAGQLMLLNAESKGFQVLKEWEPFEKDGASMSHPAIVGNRLYIRSDKELKCFEF